jgi:double-strand break repair protein MRE11
MHLVIWGHEHECKAEVEVFEEHKFHVYQPGSTIATSLIEAEEKPKGYGVFRINGLHYDFEQHFLVKSLRPMAFEQVELGRLVE